MGALTLKNFPFVLRDWDIKSFESIDPTDSFGQKTKAYVNKNKIVKIEPLFSNTTSHTWITDKGRHFFDSISYNKQKNIKRKNKWEDFFNTITKTLYLFDICDFKKSKKHFFVIVFENISLETINLLLLIDQAHAFIKIKKAENLKLNTDLETNFQAHSATKTSKLSVSTLCLLITTNTRLEGSYLNLKLRQRNSYGNFRVLSIGSFINLTLPISSLGSNVSALKALAEGTNAFCIDFINACNPVIITNSESLKRQEIQNFLHNLKIIKHTNIFNKTWNGLNVINSSLYGTGINRQSTFSVLTSQDFKDSSAFYIINANLNSTGDFKKAIKSKIIKLATVTNKLCSKKLLINQDHTDANKSFLKLIGFEKYLYLPNNAFFDSQETFVNTEGLYKTDTRVIKKNQVKDSWQLIRKLNKNIKQIPFVTNIKDKHVLFFNSKNISDFKNLTGFRYSATQSLTNFNCYMSLKSKPFSFFKNGNFKRKVGKSVSTKLKYWLDDFYVGGKDRFCHNSLVMINCSINTKLQTTNFF